MIENTINPKLVQQFTTPLDGSLSTGMPILVQAYMKSLTKRVAFEMEKNSRLEIANLLRNIDYSQRYDYWRPSIGNVLKGIQLRDSFTPFDSAIQLLLTHTELENPQSEWELTLDEPVVSTFGLIVLDNVRQLKKTDKKVLFIQTDGTETLFRAENDTWELSKSSQHYLKLKTLSTKYHLASFPDVNICGGQLADDWRLNDDDQIFLENIDPLAASVTGGFKIIEEMGQPYRDWSYMAIRHVCLLQQRGKKDILGGSSPWYPGLVNMGVPETAVAVGEILVHEAAHQYLYLLERMAPIDDGTDTKEYYSPLKYDMRPIHTMLLSYHALVVMIVYHEDYMRLSGVEDPVSVERLKYYNDCLPPFEDAIGTSEGLTESGKIFFRTLYDRVNRYRVAA